MKLKLIEHIKLTKELVDRETLFSLWAIAKQSKPI